MIKKQLFRSLSFKEKIKNIVKKEKTKSQVSQHYHNLTKWLSGEENFDKLCNYVIQHYNREQALYILDLVSSNYSKTARWVERIKP